MKIQRFYIQDEIGDKSTIEIVSQSLVNQLRNVFRLKSNDVVELFDGTGFNYISSIKDYKKESVIFSILEKKENKNIPSKDIYLLASIIKKDKYEWIAEKSTELGVSHIIPIVSERSEKKDLNKERINKIIIEASEQSNRSNIPNLHNPISLNDSIDFIKGEKNILPLVFHTEGERLNDSLIKDKIENNKSIAVFIGPEGGWTEKEIEMFHKEKFNIVCLGEQVLKAETAVISAVSKLIF